MCLYYLQEYPVMEKAFIALNRKWDFGVAIFIRREVPGFSLRVAGTNISSMRPKCAPCV